MIWHCGIRRKDDFQPFFCGHPGDDLNGIAHELEKVDFGAFEF